jgi:hypothetical protein
VNEVKINIKESLEYHYVTAAWFPLSQPSRRKNWTINTLQKDNKLEIYLGLFLIRCQTSKKWCAWQKV